MDKPAMEKPGMEKLAQEMLAMLRATKTAHERLLAMANLKLDAMRTCNVDELLSIAERERQELLTVEQLELSRRNLMARLSTALRPLPATTSSMASQVNEPLKSQLLVAAAELRTLVEQLARVNRVTSKISLAVVHSAAKVLKVITGIAQQAGLYGRTGRKAAVQGVHLLDIAG